MSNRVTPKGFKSIIKNENTVDGLYRNRSKKPDIRVSHLEDKVIISGDFELSGDLVFNSNETYDKELFFDGGNYQNIIFRGGIFKKIFFRRGVYNGYVSIRGGHINSLILLGGNFLHWLGTIDGLTHNNEDGVPIAEDQLIINRFEIEGGSYLNNIWLSGGTIKSLEIKCVTPVIIHCKPNDDKLFDSKNITYKSKFNSKPRIDNVLLSRYANKNTFYHFSELSLKKLQFENFTNLGNITLAKISLEESLTILNSDLGKLSFIDCDFSNREMHFYSSKINEIALAGVQLPNPNKINSDSYKNKDQKKLALSQIKKVYQNMGDNLMASIYQTEELNTYESTLTWSWEKLNLCLNRITNNHGQSWIKPLIILLISTGLFFSLYCLSLGFKIDFKSKDSFSLFLKNLSFYFEFLNPIRKGDFLPKALLKSDNLFNISGLTFFIDSIAKIINAYLLYQFIAAFRKFGKTK